MLSLHWKAINSEILTMYQPHRYREHEKQHPANKALAIERTYKPEAKSYPYITGFFPGTRLE